MNLLDDNTQVAVGWKDYKKLPKDKRQLLQNSLSKMDVDIELWPSDVLPHLSFSAWFKGARVSGDFGLEWIQNNWCVPEQLVNDDVNWDNSYFAVELSPREKAILQQHAEAELLSYMQKFRGMRAYDIPGVVFL